MQYRSISFSLCLIVLFIAGCATSYQPANWRGYGFSEKQLSEQSFLVSFKGNANTSPTDVQRMLLKRCAELTVFYGYSYFLIIDKDSDKKTNLTYNEATEDYNKEEEHTKSVLMFMANEKDISPEGRQKAINAGIYLRDR
ncbi:hypothetical protein [Gracilimonas sp.]|uniref:CC0125/CC1285 family lipoprotein n=1 Tax=Gracilimonas sp. TaxID=1974203 RepID=UPI0032EAAEA5